MTETQNNSTGNGAGQYPSAIAFMTGYMTPARTAEERQTAADDIIRGLASLLCGDPAIVQTLIFSNPVFVQQVQNLFVDAVMNDQALRMAIIQVITAQTNDVDRRVLELEKLTTLPAQVTDLGQRVEKLEVLPVQVASVQADVGWLKTTVTGLRKRILRPRRNRYPWLPFGVFIGAVVGFIPSFILAMTGRVGTLQEAVGGRTVLVDSIGRLTLWQWLFVSFVTLGVACLGGMIAAWARRVPVADEVVAEDQVTTQTERIEVSA